MDTLLHSSLPWELKALVCLSIAGAAALALLAVPKSWLASLGQLPMLSPNWITIWRAPMFWAGAYVHLRVSPFWGFILVVCACLLDRLDGKMAAAMVIYDVPRGTQDARTGEWLDPLVDKLTLLPMLGIFSAMGLVSPWLAILMITIDVAGTLMRPPFNLGQSLMRQSKATAAGKIKALIQSLGLITCAPYELGWLRDPIVPNIFSTLAILFGMLSVVSRMRLHPVVDKGVDRAGSTFSHF